MSLPLQKGIRLLRRLRPLSCTLACSRPDLRVKQLQSSSVPYGNVLAAVSLPALRRVGRERTLIAETSRRGTYPPVPFWSSVSAISLV